MVHSLYKFCTFCLLSLTEVVMYICNSNLFFKKKKVERAFMKRIYEVEGLISAKRVLFIFSFTVLVDWIFWCVMCNSWRCLLIFDVILKLNGFKSWWPEFLKPERNILLFGQKEVPFQLHWMELFNPLVVLWSRWRKCVLIPNWNGNYSFLFLFDLSNNCVDEIGYSQFDSKTFQFHFWSQFQLRAKHALHGSMKCFLIFYFFPCFFLVCMWAKADAAVYFNKTIVTIK